MATKSMGSPLTLKKTTLRSDILKRALCSSSWLRSRGTSCPALLSFTSSWASEEEM